jgi:hypothetical protein
VRGFGQKDAEPRRRAKTDFANCQMVSASNPIIPITRTAKCYGIIVEPMLLLCVHDLKPSLERVRDSRPNAAKSVTWVTGKWPNLRRGDHLNRGRAAALK